MGSLSELGDNLHRALGTANSVNFWALHQLLRGIIEQLIILFDAEDVVYQGSQPPQTDAGRIDSGGSGKGKPAAGKAKPTGIRKNSTSDSRRSSVATGTGPESRKKQSRAESVVADADDADSERGKGKKPRKSLKDDKGEKSDKAEKGEKSDQKGEKQGEKSDQKGEKQGEKSDQKGEKQGEKSDQKGEKQGEKSDQKGEKQGEKSDLKGEKGEKSEKGEKGEQSEKGEKSKGEKSKKGTRGERKADRKKDSGSRREKADDSDSDDSDSEGPHSQGSVVIPDDAKNLKDILKRLAKVESELQHVRNGDSMDQTKLSDEEDAGAQSMSARSRDGSFTGTTTDSSRVPRGVSLTSVGETSTALVMDGKRIPTGSAAELRAKNKTLKKALTRGNAQEVLEILKQDDEKVSGLIGQLQNDVKNLQRRMEILPDESVIYKTFFPTWKMIEEALCDPGALSVELQDALDEFGDPPVGPDASAMFREHPNKVQMIWRFLGAPGPSKRLLAILKGLGSMVSGDSGSIMSRPSKSGRDDEGRTSSTSLMRRSQTKDTLLASSLQSVDDGGFIGVKVAKVSEDVVRLRKEMDEMLRMRDRIEALENRVLELQEEDTRLGVTLDAKQEEDHNKFQAIRMDINELHGELAGAGPKKTLEARRKDMANFRVQLDADHSPVPGSLIDREARIRTQQLMMQMNMLHAMVLELEGVIPGFRYATSMTAGPPEGIQYPWGTGRTGAGTSLKAQPGAPTVVVTGGAGGVTQKTSNLAGSDAQPALMVAGKGTISPRSVSPDMVAGSRPTPLGGEQKEGMLSSTEPISQIMLRAADDYRAQLEDRNRVDQQLAKMSVELRRLNMKIDKTNDIHGQDVKKITEVIKQVHGELSDRIDNLLARMDKGGKAGASSPSKTQIGGTAQPATQSPGPLSDSVRAELFSHMANVVARLEMMEENFKDGDGAILKRPLIHCFQCLACDKPVKVIHTTPHAGPASPPLCLPPELPRLPPISSSPPRTRQQQRPTFCMPSKPVDVYEIPRQCGGSYTSSDRPRRFQFYSNLSEVLDSVGYKGFSDKVDVQGTDGHIYKGQIVPKPPVNLSNNNKILGSDDWDGKCVFQATARIPTPPTGPPPSPTPAHCQHLSIALPGIRE